MSALDDAPIDRENLPVNWFEKLTIYDIGLHVGQDTEYYLKKGFNVVAIEANSLFCDKAKKKFYDYIDKGKLTILNIGISNTHGSMDFYINSERTEWSSFHKSISGRAGGNESALSVVEVEVTTLESIIDEYGTPYYIKIDIEGNDRYALESVLNSHYQVPYISVENGNSMLKSLHRSHYSRFKYVQQNNVASLIHKYPPLEGKFIAHQFQFGASGKFGEELDGYWLGYEGVYKVISHTWNIETGEKNPDWDDSIGGWFDLHARHSNYNSILLDLLE